VGEGDDKVGAVGNLMMDFANVILAGNILL
jgi:hypothetical protein